MGVLVVLGKKSPKTIARGRIREGSSSTGLATQLIGAAQSLGKVRSRFMTAWVEMEEVA
jgi:hypothetical protein